MEVRMKTNGCTKWFASKEINAFEFKSFEREKRVSKQFYANIFILVNAYKLSIYKNINLRHFVFIKFIHYCLGFGTTTTFSNFVGIWVPLSMTSQRSK